MSDHDHPATPTVDLAAEIVAAYVSNNAVGISELPQLLLDVHRALEMTALGPDEPEPEAPKPAVSVRRSVKPDEIICLDCGKSFKSLKRHLRSHHVLTPADYRERWSLPNDYPMVAPNYASARSDLAKRMGLGQKRKSGTSLEQSSIAAEAPRRRKSPAKPNRNTERAQKAR